MFWHEDDSREIFDIPDDVCDILFAIDCKRLPVDHAYALSAAVQRAVPWITDNDSDIAVHTIHVAGSQNGWERPEPGTGQQLILSKRTKLTIRASKRRIDALMKELTGKTLDVSGFSLTIGPGKLRPLSKEKTLFSRYVVRPLGDTTARPPYRDTENRRCDLTAPTEASGHRNWADDTEEEFLNWAARELKEQGIRIHKALCGKITPLATPKGTLRTRSLLLADLSPQESVRLQQRGIGVHREMGCGIFIPHKGIDPVGKIG